MSTALIEYSGFAAIAGVPNVGKSTLMNRIAARKVSIVSHRRQTTRSVVQTITETADTQVAWLDSPGWQIKRQDVFHHTLNAGAEWAMYSADVILLVMVALPGRPIETNLIKRLPTNKPIIGIINKIDLIRDKNNLLPYIDELAKQHDFSSIIPLSAKTGAGLNLLKQAVLQIMPRSPALFGDDDAPPIGYFFADLLREKMLRHLGDEIPHQVGVMTEQIIHDEALIKVSMQVYVERESQKRIIIGKNGHLLKKLATAARLDMERYARQKVFLSVRVRVAAWRSNAALLQRMHIGPLH